MLKRGFGGRIIPVNPNRAEIQGLPAYPSIADMPEAPDVAIVAVPTQAAVAAIEQLGARGVKATIVFTAGFAEVGGDGPALQAQVTDLARAHGMRLLGPNSLGLFNDRVGFYGTFSASLEGGFPPPGRVGIVSQSGAYGTHLFTLARQRGLGTPLCITTGNEADVTVGEVIGWMVRDPDTDVIAVYAEGIRESASFVAALEAARVARKPVVMMKVGRSELGQASARSHTRLDRGRRRGDGRRAGGVRRGARPHDGGTAGHRTTRDAADLPGGQHAWHDHRQWRRRRAGERRGGGARPGHAADAGRNPGAAFGAAADCCPPQPGGLHRPGAERYVADRHLHRSDGGGGRLCVRVGLLQPDRRRGLDGGPFAQGAGRGAGAPSGKALRPVRPRRFGPGCRL
ncbi:MAG: CoA-binding protein [Acetobacteraceae bacterium]